MFNQQIENHRKHIHLLLLSKQHDQKILRSEKDQILEKAKVEIQLLADAARRHRFDMPSVCEDVAEDI